MSCKVFLAFGRIWKGWGSRSRVPSVGQEGSRTESLKHDHVRRAQHRAGVSGWNNVMGWSLPAWQQILAPVVSNPSGEEITGGPWPHSWDLSGAGWPEWEISSADTLTRPAEWTRSMENHPEAEGGWRWARAPNTGEGRVDFRAAGWTGKRRRWMKRLPLKRGGGDLRDIPVTLLTRGTGDGWVITSISIPTIIQRE